MVAGPNAANCNVSCVTPVFTSPAVDDDSPVDANFPTTVVSTRDNSGSDNHIIMVVLMNIINFVYEAIPDFVSDDDIRFVSVSACADDDDKEGDMS